MLPQNQSMVLGMEQIVPAMLLSPSRFSDLSGFVDYSAIVADPQTAGKSVSTYLNLANCFL
jgi:hypothetical protein